MIFDNWSRSFISGGETGYQALPPAVFDIFSIFFSFLKSKVVSCLGIPGQLYAMFFVIDIIYHFTCGESNLN